MRSRGAWTRRSCVRGAGRAANSAVCYCLGITAVDPSTNSLLFERFISEERKEPPDIDVDFEHERREEVIQHLYRKYGRDRAGIAATVIHYRPRSAIREVGKVMGLSEDVTAAIASTHWGSMETEIEEARVGEAGLDFADPHLRRTIALAKQLIGMPRHLSQHVGGFILTERLLTETVPIGNGAMPDRTFIEWDKDDIEELGILKIDVLALGMLTCIRKAFDLIEQHHGERFELATVPREVPEVYDMLCKGDSLGVFQVESRAQMNMLPRLQPALLLRPGDRGGDRPAGADPGRHGASLPEAAAGQGDRHLPLPLARAWSARRTGADIGADVGRPGVPGAGDEDRARRGQVQSGRSQPAAESDGDLPQSRGTIDLLQDKMVGRMVERGYDPDFAARCFHQIRGFGEYGFPESHAASFAHLVYVSSWIKWSYPAAFACALAQFAADGILRAGADRARCAGAWGDGARGGCESQRMGFDDRTSPFRRSGRVNSPQVSGGGPVLIGDDRPSPRASRSSPPAPAGGAKFSASACARSTGCGSMPRRGSSPRGPTRLMLRSRMSASVRAPMSRRSRNWRRRMRSARSSSTGAGRCGTRGR